MLYEYTSVKAMALGGPGSWLMDEVQLPTLGVSFVNAFGGIMRACHSGNHCIIWGQMWHEQDLFR